MDKYKIFMDPLKEEEWINKIQDQGYRLKNITLDLVYRFEKTTEDYITRVDYRDSMNKLTFDEYIQIHEDFGWTHVRGGRWGMTTQVWSKIKDGNDTLFSDKESKIGFYKRFSNFVGLLALLFFVYSMLFLPENNGELFLTPGLFSMEGLEFWRAFLFELPFALLRFAPVVLFPIMVIILIISYSRMQKAIKELEKE